MTAWTWVAKTAKVVWGKLKKLPGWAIGLLLILVAAIWYCVRLLAAGREIRDIQQYRILLEQERFQTVKKIHEDEDEAAAEVLKKYYEQLKKLLS